MTHSPTKNATNQGFTLIELSIVLVIIGLIVGGVLIGQDLIKAAELRAAVSQVEKYDAAANTFRGQYNGLPGDLTTAANFGMSTTGLNANGNGLINSSDDSVDGQFDEEAAGFFAHLAFANMISEPIAGTDFTTASVDAAADYMPNSRLGRGAMVAVRASGGINFFTISVPAVTNGVATWTDGSQIPVVDAFNIDTKLDDGVPSTGRVLAVTNFNDADAGAAAADDICVNTTPDPDAYNMGTADRASDTECMVRIRASF